MLSFLQKHHRGGGTGEEWNFSLHVQEKASTRNGEGSIEFGSWIAQIRALTRVYGSHKMCFPCGNRGKKKRERDIIFFTDFVEKSKYKNRMWGVKGGQVYLPH